MCLNNGDGKDTGTDQIEAVLNDFGLESEASSAEESDDFENVPPTGALRQRQLINHFN